MVSKPVATASAFIFLLARTLSVFGTRGMSNATAGVYSVAWVTVPTQDVAKKMAHTLVKKKMAACVNIIPQITSVYEWKDEINEDSELLLMIKTRTETMDSLIKLVKENHPYEVCEVISVPIEKGNEQYLNWIGKVVPASPGKPEVAEKLD